MLDAAGYPSNYIKFNMFSSPTFALYIVPAYITWMHYFVTCMQSCIHVYAYLHYYAIHDQFMS